MISLRDQTRQWTKNLKLEERDIRYLNRLEWVSSWAVAIVFSKQIKLCCLGQREKVFTFRFKTNVVNIDHIITKSEIDGLRLIRIFKNERKQKCKKL